MAAAWAQAVSRDSESYLIIITDHTRARRNFVSSTSTFERDGMCTPPSELNAESVGDLNNGDPISQALVVKRNPARSKLPHGNFAAQVSTISITNFSDRTIIGILMSDNVKKRFGLPRSYSFVIRAIISSLFYSQLHARQIFEVTALWNVSALVGFAHATSLGSSPPSMELFGVCASLLCVPNQSPMLPQPTSPPLVGGNVLYIAFERNPDAHQPDESTAAVHLRSAPMPGGVHLLRRDAQLHRHHVLRHDSQRIRGAPAPTRDPSSSPSSAAFEPSPSPPPHSLPHPRRPMVNAGFARMVTPPCRLCSGSTAAKRFKLPATAHYRRRRADTNSSFDLSFGSVITRPASSNRAAIPPSRTPAREDPFPPLQPGQALLRFCIHAVVPVLLHIPCRVFIPMNILIAASAVAFAHSHTLSSFLPLFFANCPLSSTQSGCHLVVDTPALTRRLKHDHFLQTFIDGPPCSSALGARIAPRAASGRMTSVSAVPFCASWPFWPLRATKVDTYPLSFPFEFSTFAYLATRDYRPA
ncbi:hypothetical protein DFH06DRAFT_1318561 [Mycena polygramma]|nr:hypothetical protein DFH06DRAFT_1318561 [Mycena polygramma]